LHIIETTEPIQTKFCTMTETTKIHSVGGPNRRTTNPRWRTAAILKNRKRQSTYELLLAFHRNYVPILHHIWDIATYWLKIADSNLPHLYMALFDITKLLEPHSLGYHMALFCMILSLAVLVR